MGYIVPSIVLDAGHGGEESDDRGFLGTGYEYNEGRNNYLTCVAIRDYLVANYHVNVFLTRNLISDDPGLTSRGSMYPNVDLFYSRHSNASWSHLARGTEMWVGSGSTSAKSLGLKLCENIVAFWNDPEHENRGNKDGDNYAVVSAAKAAGAKMAIMAEVGFHDTLGDSAFLVTQRTGLAQVEATTIASHMGLISKNGGVIPDVPEEPAPVPVADQKTAFKLNGITIKRPSQFKIERYNITNLQRIASAEMCGDLIAKKRKYFFNYDAISANDLNHILDIIWNTPQIFFPFDYVENNVRKSATVYTGAIPTELHRTGSNWVWKNVSFSLIEK